MRLIVLLAPLLLAGCGGATMSDRYEPPIVDMRGVDPQKHAQDQAECIQVKKDRPYGFDVGYAITECMKARGYKIVTYKG
jgi:hypothetical protein